MPVKVEIDFGESKSIFTHKTVEILRKTRFSHYKRNVFTILIALNVHRFSLVSSENINFMKKEEYRPRAISKIIEKPCVFIAFSASGGSRRRPERPPQKEKIVKKPLVFIAFP